MKALIIISLYILGAILYAAWSVADRRDFGDKVLKLGDRWKIEVGLSPAIFYMLIMTLIMIISMLWPIWIILGTCKSL